jgi:hypothetical protein
MAACSGQSQLTQSHAAWMLDIREDMENNLQGLKQLQFV